MQPDIKKTKIKSCPKSKKLFFTLCVSYLYAAFFKCSIRR